MLTNNRVIINTMTLRIIIFLLLVLSASKSEAQIKKAFKFSTFYVAANGGTSLSDRDVYSVDNSMLVYDTIFTPFDYSLTMGIRKIKRFPYEARTQFKDGLETSFSDAASVGLSPFEYLFDVFNIHFVLGAFQFVPLCIHKYLSIIHL